ncbi:BEL1-like homeodomain protein 11-like [Hibiscus syriacus]|uniref:BEL1-like homeodomain protein 11-like n=1 Tax=Hibiscus syriacus TaxID=106335 RepID=A0A6A3BBI7_HIBSY|nr:alcohol acyltransferase 9-like [Hibiscus syriacus]KAE8713387.1 BEL1-like homeodomain protein 11-like [Hibiscus syriacus]
MLRSEELPDCFYKKKPTLIYPNSATPNHSLYLSNLDDQKFLRFSIKYLYLFQKAVSLDILKYSLSKVLVHYYPLAGRLRASSPHDHKLQIDCNGQGAVFADAFMDITCHQFLQLSGKPNRSWRKLLYSVEAHSFLDIPPLVVQVTNLRCGGMILCTAINHCICDGIGTSQFLHAWSYVLTKPKLDFTFLPFHFIQVLKARDPPQITHTNLGYTKTTLKDNYTHVDINQYLQSQPLVPTSLTFTPTHILCLKRQYFPSLKCTHFEALASHTWRSWVQSLDLSPPSLKVKLLFSVNVRKKLVPELPQGYYGNGIVLACAETVVKDLVNVNLYHAIKLIQQAKSSLTDGNVRSMIDLLEDKNVKTDTCSSLVISQWAKLGLEDLDFGEGEALHMGPLTSDIYCLFLPVVGNFDSVRVQVSVPESVVEKFEYYMMDGLDKEDK